MLARLYMDGAGGAGDANGASDDAAAQALTHLLRALERYPAPLPTPTSSAPGRPPRFRYTPALDAAMDLYTSLISGTDLEVVAVEAFVGVAPKVLERSRAVVAQMRAARAPELAAEYHAAMHELGVLAAIFVGDDDPFAGPYGKLYAEVCSVIDSVVRVLC